jgi:hypothetical protein
MQFLASSSIMLEQQFFRDDEGESFRNVGLQVRIDRGRSPEILSLSAVVKGYPTQDRMPLYCTETLHQPGQPVRAAVFGDTINGTHYVDVLKVTLLPDSQLFHSVST